MREVCDYCGKIIPYQEQQVLINLPDDDYKVLCNMCAFSEECEVEEE